MAATGWESHWCVLVGKGCQGSTMSKNYHRDDSLPYWKSNVDVDALLEDHAFRQDDAILMKGHFEGGFLRDHTFSWTFTPGVDYDPAIIFSVRERGRLVDILAMATHN